MGDNMSDTPPLPAADVAGTFGLVPDVTFASRAGALAAFTGFSCDVDDAHDAARAAGFTRISDFGEGDYWTFHARNHPEGALLFEYIEGDVRLYVFDGLDATVEFCSTPALHF